jgi:hypothetical protein
LGLLFIHQHRILAASILILSGLSWQILKIQDRGEISQQRSIQCLAISILIVASARLILGNYLVKVFGVLGLLQGYLTLKTPLPESAPIEVKLLGKEALIHQLIVEMDCATDIKEPNNLEKTRLQLRNIYKKFAVKYHPDKNPKDPEKFKTVSSLWAELEKHYGSSGVNAPASRTRAPALLLLEASKHN